MQVELGAAVQELIAVLQYATAATFAVIGLTAYRHGDAAQRAAEDEVTRQGFSPDLLTRHRVRVAESLAELVFPLAIAAVLAVMATLTLAAPGPGRTVTWILQPILLLAGGFITGNQVFVNRFVAAAFRRSPDTEARAVDIGAVLDAASGAFPRWLRPLIVIRFLLVTFGSVAVLLLLLVT